LPRKKILITASTLPRWDGDIEPDFILQLAAHLADRFDVTVLAPHAPGALRHERMAGVRVVRFRYAPDSLEHLAYAGGMLHKLKVRPWRWLLVPCFIGSQLLSAWRLQRRHRFDLLHAHWIVPQGLVAALMKSLGLFRRPVILTSHGGDLFSLSGPLLSGVKRWALARADLVNVVSRAMQAPAVSLGIPEDRLLVRSMGVDLGGRFVAETPFEQRSGLVFVGRLVEKKGLEVLIRAFAPLAKERPGLALTVVGHGPLEQSLKALSRELDCESSVHFTGPVRNDEVPRYLNAARIAAVPSVVAADGDQEGLGLVAVEAMGCGCAVVASDLPALRDVVEPGVDGVMVKAGDSDLLSRALAELIDDPARCRRLAEAATTAAQKFSWPTVSADYAREYERLISDEANLSGK
jgi:glycosyltransferase involved in cell wall biosynthesis